MTLPPRWGAAGVPGVVGATALRSLAAGRPFVQIGASLHERVAALRILAARLSTAACLCATAQAASPAHLPNQPPPAPAVCTRCRARCTHCCQLQPCSPVAGCGSEVHRAMHMPCTWPGTACSPSPCITTPSCSTVPNWVSWPPAFASTPFPPAICWLFFLQHAAAALPLLQSPTATFPLARICTPPPAPPSLARMQTRRALLLLALLALACGANAFSFASFFKGKKAEPAVKPAAEPAEVAPAPASDTTGNAIFWYNEVTGESSWELPTYELKNGAFASAHARNQLPRRWLGSVRRHHCVGLHRGLGRRPVLSSREVPAAVRAAQGGGLPPKRHSAAPGTRCAAAPRSPPAQRRV